jgi:hypothetical protein
VRPIAWIGLLAAVGLLAAAAAGASANGTPAPTRLKPAPDPPVARECRHALLHDADGNVEPLTCAPGKVNVEAWQWYARNTFVPLLALPRSASLLAAEKALCSPQSSTGPNRMSEYTLASLYNGWHFTRNPIALWESVSCAKLVRGKA